MFSTEDKIKALKREVAMRQAVYRRQVGRGQMSQAEADREVAVMAAILKDYETGGVPAFAEQGAGMTLDTFQTRLRGIVDVFVSRAMLVQTAFADDFKGLQDEAVAAWEANPEAFAAVAQAEIARLQKAMEPS